MRVSKCTILYPGSKLDKFATQKEDTVPSLRIVIYKGLFRESNPGPLAPKARIIPLDQTADAVLLKG